MATMHNMAKVGETQGRQNMGQLIVLKTLQSTVGESIHTSQVAMLPDGYVNLSHICKAGGKDYWRWEQLPSSKRELERIEKRMIINNDHGKLESHSATVLINTGPKQYHGHYGPIRLALSVAMWAREEFHDQVLDWLTDIQMGVVVDQEQIRQAVFAALLLPDPSSWEARFPPKFWKALARVDGGKVWRVPKDHKKSWAPFIGTYIYEEMFRDTESEQYVSLPDALAELRRKNPYRLGEWERMRRNHQHLTEMGLQRLTRQIDGVTQELETYYSTCTVSSVKPTLDGWKKMFAAKQHEASASVQFQVNIMVSLDADETGQYSLFHVS